MKEKPTAWELFWSLFKEGDEVICIDDEDVFHWGRLKTYSEDNFLLCRPYRQEALHWEDIRFMCHDGFPVRKLTGADGSKLIEDAATDDIVTLIRQGLSLENKREATIEATCCRCGLTKTMRSRNYYGIHYDDNHNATKRYLCDDCPSSNYVAGDPFYIEGVNAVLLNAGNDGREFWNEDGEEVLVLRAKDGARGLLYDLNTIYHIDTA